MASKLSKRTTASSKTVSSRSTAKPVKKSAAKTKSSTKTVTQPFTFETPKKTSVTTTGRTSVRMKKSYVLLVIIIVALAVFLYYYRGLFVAAVVNGQPISRLSVVHETEKQSGKQALTTLVRNALIEQEAKKQNVTVSDKEIDDEIKKVEASLSKQGQKIDQVLAMQGMSRQDLRKLIRLDKLVGKMVGKDIKISDKQVNDYIDKNKDQLPQNQSESQLKATVKDQLKQQELNQKVQSWLTTLQKNSKVNYFVQY
jgi:foldase protein PrsA